MGLGVFASNDEYRPPRVLDVNIGSEPTTSHGSTSGVSKGGESKTNTRVGCNPRSMSEQHPRYLIVTEKCTSEVYKVIKPDEDYAYSALLGTDPLLHDHPRQRNIDHIYALKPIWYGHKSYDDWFSWKKSNQPDEQMEE